jgi:hypothetical protein
MMYFDGDPTNGDLHFDPRAIPGMVHANGAIEQMQIQTATLGGIWSGRRNQFVMQNDFIGLGRCERQAQVTDGFIRMNSHLDLDTLFDVLEWHRLNPNKSPNFAELAYAGVSIPADINGMDTATIWKILEEITPQYRESRGQRQSGLGLYQQMSDQILAQRLDTRGTSLPLSYEYINTNPDIGIITPTFRNIAEINKRVLTGGTVYMFCCPDYSREQRPDGTFEYTMDGLGNSEGLTAQRGIPVVADMICNSASTITQPIHIAIGIADFEATAANAEMVGLADADTFEMRLNESLGAMVRVLQTELGSDFDIEIQTADDPADGNIKRRTAAIYNEQGRCVAQVAFDRVTSLVTGQVGTEARSVFDQEVTGMRETLMTRVDSDPAFHAQLDKLIQLRLNLMLKWSGGYSNGDEIPELLVALSKLICDLEEHDFETTVEIDPRFSSIVEGLAGLGPKRKEALVKQRVFNLIHDDPADQQDSLTYLRKKAARQGAEYAVMHRALASDPHSCQFVADAMNMWQVFGAQEIPVLGIKGGYAGADKI